MFPKSLSFSKKQTMYYDQHTAGWILLKKKNSACVVIYLKTLQLLLMCNS